MTRVNLLRPRLPSRERRRERRLGYAALAMALLCAFTVVGWWIARCGVRAAEEEIALAEARLRATAGRVQRWQAVRDETRLLARRLEALALVPPVEKHFAELLEDVVGACIDGCELEGVAVDPEAGLTLRGKSDSHPAVADYLERLRALPALASAELRFSARPGGTGEVTFEVEADLAETEVEVDLTTIEGAVGLAAEGGRGE